MITSTDQNVMSNDKEVVQQRKDLTALPILNHLYAKPAKIKN
jgi:hypothetical protein